MKILFFTRRYSPDIGGVETHVREVSKRLSNLGHSVTIVTEMPSGNLQSLSAKVTDSYTNATVYRIPISTSEKRKKFIIWNWLRKHKDLIKEADIIHVHDVFFWYLPFRFRYPNKLIFTTFHGYETVFPPKQSAILHRRLAAQLSHGNINVGDYIRKWYGTHATYVTYGGVSLDEKLEITSEKKRDKLRIVFVGRIEKDNSVEKYSALLDLLKLHRISFTFTAIGDGSQSDLFKKHGNITGFQKDISEEIDKADVFFASSYLSMLNAAIRKKLIISFYDNPLKQDYLEVSPFARFSIIETSPTAAYNDLKLFILNPNRLKKTLEIGYEWARTQTWDEVVKLYLKLWKKK